MKQADNSNTPDKLRIDSLKWGADITEEQRETYFKEYDKFTPAQTHTQLTGREIQNIWAVKTAIPEVSTPIKDKVEDTGDLLSGITGGEWKVNTATKGSVLVYTDQFEGKYFKKICEIKTTTDKTMYGVLQSQKEAEANCKLIASAPTLAASNKQLQEENKALRAALQDIKNLETGGSRFDIIRIVNMALNK